MKPLRIGTRGSALALWQAHWVSARLGELDGLSAEVVVLKTSGDRFDQKPIGALGLKGVFIRELEQALAEGRVDLAVHSMKDVPGEVAAGLAFPALTRREEVRDCLVSRRGATLGALPSGARVGTSSLRRQAQLLHLRADLNIVALRGNVDTRLAKLARGECDAIVLAKAGLDRLGWADRVTEIFSPEAMLPAAGQGALGIEARAADAELCRQLARLDDSATRAAVTAERTLLAELQGGCQLPLGAWGRIEEGRLLLDACVCSADGAEYLRRSAVGAPEEPEALGRALAAELLEAGAEPILKLAGRSSDGR